MISIALHTPTKILPRETQKRFAGFLMVSIGVCVFLYIYFIGVSIFSSLAREDMNNAIRTTNSQVGELESTYIALDKGITLPTAEAMGFVQPRGVLYTQPGSFAASFGSHEIR